MNEILYLNTAKISHNKVMVFGEAASAPPRSTRLIVHIDGGRAETDKKIIKRQSIIQYLNLRISAIY